VGGVDDSGAGAKVGNFVGDLVGAGDGRGEGLGVPGTGVATVGNFVGDLDGVDDCLVVGTGVTSTISCRIPSIRAQKSENISDPFGRLKSIIS